MADDPITPAQTSSKVKPLAAPPASPSPHFKTPNRQPIISQSSRSSHRLPTLSASQALHAASTPGSSPLSFGLPRLDALLCSFSNNAPESVTNSFNSHSAGLPRGQLTEIYGPPGSGKTALCLQAACQALKQGLNVVWIDCASRVPAPRLLAFLRKNEDDAGDGSNSQNGDGGEEEAKAHKLLENLTHFHVPTLPHLIALLTPLPPGSDSNPLIPPSTSLIVIESLPLLLDTFLPRHNPSSFSTATTGATTTTSSQQLPSATSKRLTTLTHLSTLLTSLAARTNAALLLSSHMVTRISRPSHAHSRATPPAGRALLRPALGASDSRERDLWTDAVARRRVCLFRDFAVFGDAHAAEREWEGLAVVDAREGKEDSARFAWVPGRRARANSTRQRAEEEREQEEEEEEENIIPFKIQDHAIISLPSIRRFRFHQQQRRWRTADEVTRGTKRRRSGTDADAGERAREEEDEAASGSDDEYGWSSELALSADLERELSAREDEDAGAELVGLEEEEEVEPASEGLVASADDHGVG